MSDFTWVDVDDEASGLDDFLSDQPVLSFDELVAQTIAEEEGKTASVVRVASLHDLQGFTRVANTNTLIRKSDRDFWNLEQDENGDYVIRRLFDENGDPLTEGA